MHIDLNRSGSKTLPHQISETLSQRISSGLLQQGVRLPSVRSLAITLNVSQVTVSKAYDMLERRGLIYCRQGKGCFVADPTHNRRHEEGCWQDLYDDYLPRAQLWRNFDVSEVKYPFHLAAIHSELLPLQDIGDTYASLVKEQPELMATYGNFQEILSCGMS